MPEQRRLNEQLLRLAPEAGLPLVVTNDLHYVREDQSEAHDVLLCVGTGNNLDTPNRLRFDTHEFYVKSAAQMAALFPDQLEAIRNTRRIAEMTDVELPLGQLRIPHFPVPDGETVESWLRKECEAGLARRYGTVTPELQERLDYELGVILAMGYAGYFLIVADFIGFAREQGIQTTCRGSAPGSIVTYTLGHHAGRPDPLPAPVRAVPQPGPRDDARHRRRLRGRPARRGHRLRRAQVRPGPRRPDHHVRHDARPRRDPRRRSGARPLATARWTASPRRSRTSSGSGSTRRSQIAPALREQVDADPGVKRIIDFARHLEGVARNASTHAAGVVISREPLTELMPLQRATNSDGLMTQYEMHAIEALGLLKFDFLGLSNLTILRQAVDIVRADRGVAIDLDTIPLDDARDVRAAGVRRDDRHLPAGVGRDAALHPRAAPTSVYDLAAMVALYRPGPDGQHPGLHPPQARPGAGDLPAPAARAVPGEDLRDLRLPGGHHGRRDRARRLHRSGGRHARIRDPEEEVVGPARPEGEVRPPGRRTGCRRPRPSTRCSPPSNPSSAMGSTRPTPPATA